MANPTTVITHIDSEDDVLLEIFAEIMGEWSVTEKNLCDEDCLICLEPIHGTYTITTGCDHTFHRNCLFKNLLDFARERCPVCNLRFLFLDKINTANPF